MKLFYFNAQEGDTPNIHRALGDTVSVQTLPESLTEETVELAKEADMISIFVNSQVSPEILAQLPHLKMIATRSTGFDHIDAATCAARDILVTNVPTYGERTVAEHTFALMLALSRKLLLAYERTERMHFDRQGLQGFDLYQKTLGVVGTGNIGRNVIRIGLGFGMKVVAYDVHPDHALAKELGFTYVDSFEKLLEASDVVTLHVPYVPQTFHLINQKTVQHMRKGSLLINTARGEIVDTSALIWALDNGILAGAGLDVLEEEQGTYDPIDFLTQTPESNKRLVTLLRNHILIARNDVIITPHNAYNSKEALDRIFETTMDNIRAYIAGKPINVVSLKS